MCGLPVKASAGNPRRIHARWMYAFRSSPSYHSALRTSAPSPCPSGNLTHPTGRGPYPDPMRAFVVTAPRTASVVEVAAPVAGAGQVVVDVARVGICGTDVEFFTGAMS